MIPTDREKLFKEVHRARSFYSKTTTPEELAIWWDALKDEYLSDVSRALDAHMKYGRFAPMPADVMKRIHGEDKTGDGGGSRDMQCSFTVNGQRCPALWSVTNGGSPLCGGHYAVQGSRVKGEELLRLYLDHGIPFKPHRSDELCARLLLERLGEEEVLEVYGQKTLDYILSVPAKVVEPTPDPQPHKDQQQKVGSFLDRVRAKR
jgi:hypothetical protein